MPDLVTLKRSLPAFAEAIGYPLAPWQAEALTLRTRLTCIAAGRQMGKSRALAILALWWAFRQRDQHVLIVSASDSAARRVLAVARSMAAGSRLLSSSVVDEQRSLLTIDNGSVIRSVAASEPAVRGNTVDLGLADEVALQPDSLVLDAFMPTMSARRDARAVLVSSASRATGAFYDLFRRGELGEEHSASFRWVSRLVGGSCDADWIAPSGIALDEATFSPVRFRAEHMAEFAGGGSALFTHVQLDRMFVDYRPDTLATLHGPARVTLGIDWGASSDRSAAVALGRIPMPDGQRLFGVRAVRRWDAGALLPGVVQEIAASPAHFQGVVAELNGLGTPCAQMLWAALEQRSFTHGGGRNVQPRVVMVEERGDLGEAPPVKVHRPKYQGFVTQKYGVVTSAGSKASVWSAIRLAIDKGELIAPSSETELRRELALLDVEMTAAGGERIQASVGHDDLADSLYLACVPVKPDGGQWGCALATWTDRRHALPDAQVPPEVAASPHVPGPDGISVPVRPAWQSIVGTALTVPEGLEFSTEVDPRLRETRERVQAAINDNQ